MVQEVPLPFDNHSVVHVTFNQMFRIIESCPTKFYIFFRDCSFSGHYLL